jgi:2-hydroxy-3-oxopropionate reductase
MTFRKIAVIGLGAMGTPIASLLLRAGHQVCGFDISKARMLSVAKNGLTPTKSAREASKGADLILLSLPNWQIVREVVEGKEGIIEAVKKGVIILDTSTVPPWETKAMAKRVSIRGIDWMDVPVSGSASQAKEGNIVFMAGGKKRTFNKIKPILDKIGKRTIYVGKNGEAAMLKLVVNQTLFLQQAAAIEGFVLGIKAGLNSDVMLDALVSGAACSDLILARGKDMISGNFEPKGPLWIAIKDIGYILESAKRYGVMLPMASLYQQFLLEAHYKGWDKKDATVVMRIYEQMANLRQKMNGRE